MALAQRIMDDIIDLELEKIEKIIAKIDSDPASEEVKEAEKHLDVYKRQQPAMPYSRNQLFWFNFTECKQQLGKNQGRS